MKVKWQLHKEQHRNGGEEEDDWREGTHTHAHTPLKGSYINSRRHASEKGGREGGRERGSCGAGCACGWVGAVGSWQKLNEACLEDGTSSPHLFLAIVTHNQTRGGDRAGERASLVRLVIAVLVEDARQVVRRWGRRGGAERVWGRTPGKRARKRRAP